MKQLICFASIILQLWISVNANGYYTIVAPGSIQSDTDYTVTVTVHDNTETATIKVGISGPSYNETKTIDLPPYSAEIVHFEVPPLEEGTYELQTEGLKGLIFKRYSNLTFSNEGPKIYIQTDKALYKPGEFVKFRILALDVHGKPAIIKEALTLRIYDSAQNIIKEVKELQFTKGVHSAKLQLSEQPVLGDWTIEVFHKSDNQEPKSHPVTSSRPDGVMPAAGVIYIPLHGPKTTKRFEVAKYVLPKFSVEIEADKKVAILDKSFKVTVRSKYTYGQPVQGNTTITAYFSGQNHDTAPAAEKTMDIKGKADVEFNLLDDLGMGHYMHRITVTATVTEGHTGLQQNTTTYIDVDSSRYTIDIQINNHTVEINQPFEIKAVIKKLNGLPVTNAKSTAKLILSQYSNENSRNGLMFEADVDKIGEAVFKIKLSWPQTYDHIKVMFEEKIETHGSRLTVVDPKLQSQVFRPSPGRGRFDGGLYTPDRGFYRPPQAEYVGPLKIFVKTAFSKFDEDIIVEVKSDDPIPYFFYTIMARGKIVKHEYIKVGGNKKSYTLNIHPSYEMAPKSEIFAYLIDDGDMKSATETLNILLDEFKNKIEITAPEVAKASELVSVNIKTDPESFVGLLAVDQSVLLLKSGNDFEASNILSNIGRLHVTSPPDNGRHTSYPGKNSGFVTITNACYPRRDGNFAPHMAVSATGVAGGPGIGYASYDSPQEFSYALYSTKEPTVRKNFVETWIFDDIESTDSNGIANFTTNIPDTMTSWVITGFTINDKNGFGMTHDPTNIRVFQPFFVSLNLPYSVKRGEIVEIPVTVFNYMTTQVEAEITMENADDEYSFLGPDQEQFTEEKVMSKQVTIPSNSGSTVSFKMFPKIVGDITLKIKAVTPLAGDSVHQKLKVEPEGVTQYKNEALFVSIPSGGEPFVYTFKAEIPPEAITNSEFIEFTAVSDLLGPTIENIDSLIRMPYGCGEQNMINFVPNILVLDYLESMKINRPTLMEKAKNFMLMGYQRQLTYKHQNGAYSTFGEGRTQPNNWLTAYVARSFIRARKYITVDESLIEKALQYLASNQDRNGQFIETQTSFFNSHKTDNVGKTAYILLAFLESEEYSLKFKPQIRKGIDFLQSRVDNEDDLHTLALISLVLKKAKHSKLEGLLEKLEHRAHKENNLKWWPSSSKYQNDEIEVTSYVLQTLLETPDVDATKVLPIIKWLIGKRNNLGGFASTQDTVVGLEALIKFSEKFAAAGSGNINVKYQAQNEAGEETSNGSFTIEEKNGLALISYEFSKSTRQLIVTAEGEGSAILQFSYRYNLATKDDNAGFILKYSPNAASSKDHISMNICAEYKPDVDDEIKESNMAVMEIFLPSGFRTDEDSLEHIRSVPLVQRVETKNDDTVIVVYFDMLVADEPACFDFYAENYYQVDKLRPAAITIYDYYNNKQSATVFYEVK
ncbi:CD109 antigen-like [Haematobia irritans]|uniref:CD109 antigen-like n=1 Tax=Haematobia irritans TaxID=7368 RepID=UPI003F4F999E